MKRLRAVVLACLITTLGITFSPFARAATQTSTGITTVFSDDFTDTDGTPVTLHNSNWFLEDHTPEPVIKNNTLYMPALQSNIGIYNTAADQCASFDVQFPLFPNALIGFSVRNRIDSKENLANYGTYINDADHSFALEWSGEGTRNNYLSSYILDPYPSAGWHNYKMCAVGNHITVYLGNSVLAAVDDSHVPAPGFPKIEIGRAHTYIDNFVYQEVSTTSPHA
jgi:hypothetical protein